MPERLRSLRFRLTATFILIFGLLQAGLWGAVDALRTGYLRSTFDQRLVEQAETAIDVLDAELRRGRSLRDADNLSRLLQPLERGEFYLQVRAGDGAVVYTSKSLRGGELPFTPLVDKSYDTVPYLTTVGIERAKELGADGALRTATYFQNPAARESYYLAVGADLAPVDHIVTDMRQLLIVFGFVSLVIAGCTTWYMARKSLEPIDMVARRAKQLSAAHLTQRIPVPQSQDEVSEMVVVVNDMLDRLEGTFRDQQRFIGDASHELKTPLAVLLAEAQALIRRPFDKEECAQFARTVEAEVRKLLRIVETFLILSRAQPGQRPAMVQEVHLEEIVTEAIYRCRVEAAQNHVSVVPKLAGDAPDSVVAGDSELLYSMAESLLFNAIRNTPQGGNVEIAVRSENASAVLSVRDAGPTIPDRDWQQLFKVFYQAPPTDQCPGRSGTGLSIVKAVAELHGGSVSVRNLNDGGCEFNVRLPTACDLSDSRAEFAPSDRPVTIN